MSRLNQVYDAYRAAAMEWHSMLWQGSYHMEIFMSRDFLARMVSEDSALRYDPKCEGKGNYLFGCPLNLCDHLKGGYLVALVKGDKDGQARNRGLPEVR